MGFSALKGMNTIDLHINVLYYVCSREKRNWVCSKLGDLAMHACCAQVEPSDRVSNDLGFILVMNDS